MCEFHSLVVAVRDIVSRAVGTCVGVVRVLFHNRAGLVARRGRTLFVSEYNRENDASQLCLRYRRVEDPS